jgi:colanic acid/amylovoran biosynthesis protein
VESFYSEIVRAIGSSGRLVVLLTHSTEDLALCTKIERAVGDAVQVWTTSGDLDAVELEGLIGQMDFMVASRYHSLVHAYRRRVPSVIVGWADKYYELAGLVGQEKFVLGADACLDEVLAEVRYLIDSHRVESQCIDKHMRDLGPDAVAEVVKGL